MKSGIKVLAGLIVLGAILTAIHLLPYLIVFTAGFAIGGSGSYVLVRRQIRPGVEYRKLDE